MTQKASHSVHLQMTVPKTTVNIFFTSAVCLASLALTTRHISLLVSLFKGIGRSTDILEMIPAFCSLLRDCDKFLQLLMSFPNPNITVQDLSVFVLVVFKKVHVIFSVSTSNVKSTSKNWFLEPIMIISDDIKVMHDIMFLGHYTSAVFNNNIMLWLLMIHKSNL